MANPEEGIKPTSTIIGMEMVSGGLGRIRVKHVSPDGFVSSSILKFYLSEDAEIEFARPELVTSEIVEQLRNRLIKERLIVE